MTKEMTTEDLVELKARLVLLERESHRVMGENIALVLALRSVIEVSKLDHHAFRAYFAKLSARIHAKEAEATFDPVFEMFLKGFKGIEGVLTSTEPAVPFVH